MCPSLLSRIRARDGRRRGRALTGRLALAGACALFAACGPASDRTGDEAAVRMLPTPLEKPDLVFSDANGARYDLRAETAGFVTLLFFGYTSCPDICPVQMANVGAVLRDLPPESSRRIKVVFVTTDPERDTPERLREWLSAIHPSFVGLRGPLDQVHAAEASLLLPSSVIEAPHGAPTHDAPPQYFVGHASPVVVFDADGLARRMYPAGTRQQDWRRDLPKIVAAAEAQSAAPEPSLPGGVGSATPAVVPGGVGSAIPPVVPPATRSGS